MSLALGIGIGIPFGDKGWGPRDLGSSLFAWWSADRADLITLSGSQVVTWRDVVAGYALTQGISGSRPAYSATSFNGVPGITFDGIDDELTLASVPFPTGSSPSEIWGLVDQKMAAVTAANGTIFSYGSTSNVTRRLVRVRGSGPQNQPQAGVGDGAAIQLADLAVDFSGRHVVRGSFSATAEFVQMDGTAGTPTSVVPSTATTRTRMGANSGASAGEFINAVYRDLIVTDPLTTDQATLLNTFLMNRRMP